MGFGKSKRHFVFSFHVIGFCMHAHAHTAKMRISARRYACLLFRLLLPPAAAARHICCRCLLCEHQARGRSGLEVILGRDPELLAMDSGRVGRSAEHESASFYTRHKSLLVAT